MKLRFAKNAGLIAISLTMLVNLMGADAKDAPISPAAKRAKSDYEAAVRKANAELNEKMRIARAQYIKDLEDARKSALTMSNLDEAQRILAEKTRIEVTQKISGGTGASFEIICAKWGARGTWSDMTKEVNAYIQDSKLSFAPGKTTWPDPLFGVHKSLAIVYMLNGKIELTIWDDESNVELPPGR